MLTKHNVNTLIRQYTLSLVRCIDYIRLSSTPKLGGG